MILCKELSICHFACDWDDDDDDNDDDDDYDNYNDEGEPYVYYVTIKKQYKKELHNEVMIVEMGPTHLYYKNFQNWTLSYTNQCSFIKVCLRKASYQGVNN